MSGDEEGKVMVKLEQVSSHSHRDLDGDVSVGDNIGVYEVVDKYVVDCDHPNYHVQVRGDEDGDGKVVSRRCRVCGFEEVVPLDEVDWK